MNNPIVTASSSSPLKHIVVYDIPNDKQRLRLAKLLKSYGLKRLQYSVFGGELSQNMIETLAKDVQRIISDTDGDVRLLYVCPHRETNQLVIRQRVGSMGELLERDDVAVL